MILVDTSVWIDHIREGLPSLVTSLNQNSVLMHPFVLGELACGNLKSRHETLRLLANLPNSTKASDAEVLQFVETHKLMGKGIGLIDAHLLASAALSAGAVLWTHDKPLAQIAKKLKLGHHVLAH